MNIYSVVEFMEKSQRWVSHELLNSVSMQHNDIAISLTTLASFLFVKIIPVLIIGQSTSGGRTTTYVNLNTGALSGGYSTEGLPDTTASWFMFTLFFYPYVTFISEHQAYLSHLTDLPNLKMALKNIIPALFMVFIFFLFRFFERRGADKKNWRSYKVILAIRSLLKFFKYYMATYILIWFSILSFNWLLKT